MNIRTKKSTPEWLCHLFAVIKFSEWFECAHQWQHGHRPVVERKFDSIENHIFIVFEMEWNVYGKMKMSTSSSSHHTGGHFQATFDEKRCRIQNSSRCWNWYWTIRKFFEMPSTSQLFRANTIQTVPNCWCRYRMQCNGFLVYARQLTQYVFCMV